MAIKVLIHVLTNFFFIYFINNQVCGYQSRARKLILNFSVVNENHVLFKVKRKKNNTGIQELYFDTSFMFW